MGFALALGVGMAALAASIGLAPIVGAFLGGMLLSEVREKYRLEEPIFAIESFLAPIFFASSRRYGFKSVGVRLELSALASPVVLVAGTVVTVIAILGKVLGGFLGALTQGVRSALTVGVGMAPLDEKLDARELAAWTVVAQTVLNLDEAITQR